VSERRFEEIEARRGRVKEEIDRLARCRVSPGESVNGLLSQRGATPIAEATPLLHLLRRPELTYADLARLMPDGAEIDHAVAKQVEVSVKYEGYVARMLEDVARFRRAEEWALPLDLDYTAIPGLSTEVKERLSTVRPSSLGQASRVPGVTPAAMSILSVWCHRRPRG
jgi:tRNA uridine 5-carboxymethylaminomethyl modification enzyme